MGNIKLIGGLLAGAAIGVVVGLLVAPEKVAKVVKKGAGQLKDKSEDLIDEAQKTVKDRFERGVDEVSRRAKNTIRSAGEGPSY